MHTRFHVGDNSLLSTWSDLFTDDPFDATQSGTARPTYQQNSINGQATLYFNGTSSLLTIADAAALNTGGAPCLQRTFIIVFKTGGDVTSRQILYEQGGGTRGLSIYIDNGRL